jgi:hypothetical protein
MKCRLKTSAKKAKIEEFGNLFSQGKEGLLFLQRFLLHLVHT